MLWPTESIMPEVSPGGGGLGEVTTPAGGKVCSKCGEWKILESYYRCTRNSDGRRADCRRCFGERVARRDRARAAASRWQWTKKGVKWSTRLPIND